MNSDVAGLLLALDVTPLSWLSDVVRLRIESELGPDMELGDVRRGLEELRIADAVVVGALDRELKLTARLAELAPLLEVKSIGVLDGSGGRTTGLPRVALRDELDAAAELPRSEDEDDLLSDVRALALQELILVWKAASAAVAEILGGDDFA